METPPPPPGPARAPDAPDKKYSLTDYTFQFITITAGVLIALLINGLVEWNSNRTLVREALATIAQEIVANEAEVKDVLAGHEARAKNLDGALALTNQLLALNKPASASLNLGYNVADLSTAGWDSAGRTGAIAHMDYADVQKYSQLYSHQELFAGQQAKAMEHVTAALAIFSDTDPLSAKPADLERFRERLLLMKAGMLVEQQLGERLLKDYTAMLGR